MQLSALLALGQDEWVEQTKSKADKTSTCFKLIDLILQTNPTSARLISYYRAALLAALIQPAQAATHLIQHSTHAISPSHDKHCSAAKLSQLNSLAAPLLNSHPTLLLDYTPPLQSLHSLIHLILSSQHHPSQTTSLLRLAEHLVVQLSTHILSYPAPSLLLEHQPAQPLVNSLLSICRPSEHQTKTSNIYTHQLPSILRHLSPSTAKTLAFSRVSHPSQPPHPPTSLLAYILLTPGSSALCFDQEQQIPLLLSRIVCFAISLPKNTKFVFEFVLAAINLANHPISSTTRHCSDQDENHKMAWKALLGGGRLAELIRLALDSPLILAKQSDHELLTIAELDHLSQILIQQPQATLSSNSHASPSDQPSHSHLSQLSSTEPCHYTHRHHLWFALLSSLCSNQLVVPQDIAKIESLSACAVLPSSEPLPHPNLLLGHHSQINLGLLPLIECLGLNNKQITISEIAGKLNDTLHMASRSFDLSTCISITKAIGTKESLTTIFLWIKPSTLLVPITNILDHWTDFKNQNGSSNNQMPNPIGNDGNVDDESSSAGEFEKFAALLGWIQGVVGWFGLKKSLRYHLERTTGFTISYLVNPSTTYAIDSLPAKQKNTLESWLEALYGSSGISDELLIKTDPRIFFKICTTSLFKQSFDALKIGLIDLQSFRDGLSYFEQELLVVGSAVGVVGWLLDELDRVGTVSPASYPTALLEILQAILLSSAITPTSIELISARSLRLLRRFTSIFSSSSKTASNEVNQGDLNRRVQLDIDKIEKKLTTVPVSGLITPTDFLAFHMFGHNQGSNLTDKNSLESILKRAIRQAILIDEEEHSPNGLWSLLPHVLDAVPVDQFIKITISGIIDTIKSGEQNISSDTNALLDHRIGVRVEPEWDVQKYFRVERAIQVAVDILTWPFDSHHYHQSKLTKIFPEELSSLEDQNLVANYNSKFKLIGSVLLELFINWGKRTQTYQGEFGLDHALMERDIIIQCLDRMQILEKVCFGLSSSASSEKNNKEEPSDHSQLEKKYKSIVTDYFRQACFKSLVIEKIKKQPSENKKKRKMNEPVESKTEKVMKFKENVDENKQNDVIPEDDLNQEAEKNSERDLKPKESEGGQEESNQCINHSNQEAEPMVLDHNTSNMEPSHPVLTRRINVCLKKTWKGQTFDLLDWILVGLHLQLVPHHLDSFIENVTFHLDRDLQVLQKSKVLVVGLGQL